jgi:hypothetical protein
MRVDPVLISEAQRQSSSYAIAQTTHSDIEPSSGPSHTLRANLHVLIPASKPDPNLCKAIVSGRVLGYPSPTIINWDQTFDDPAFVEGGSHLAKINGTAQYLYSLDETHDHDLVLMLDGYDAWIQLRPQTLVDRFYDINARANKRIDGTFEDKNGEQTGARQDIIFGAQKRCWPWSVDDPPCYAVPQSSLPSDIYGPATDTDVSDEENPYTKYRQRFLNSGVAMGRVGAMRKMFDQALAQAPEDANFGSDQYIFSHIFGDQELYREILRRDAGLTPRDGLNEEHIEEVRAKAAARQDGSFEFGIGLDYGSEIGLNTVFAEDDTEWIRFEDRDQIHEAQNNRGITRGNRRPDAVADDISLTAPPFEEVPWSNVSLFTDVWTGNSPVVVHHNAHRNGMKALRETWWPKIWFQNELRILLDASGAGPTSYVAIGKPDGREYWPEEVLTSDDGRDHVAKEASSGRWLPYSDLCGEYDEEVFRDGRGWFQRM